MAEGKVHAKDRETSDSDGVRNWLKRAAEALKVDGIRAVPEVN